MSKIFYDHLLSLEIIEKEINKISENHEEKNELWNIVDEIIHHRVMGCILDKLPRESHEEFLEKFHSAPHDENLLTYLKSKIDVNFEEIIKEEIGDLAYELLQELKVSSKNNE